MKLVQHLPAFACCWAASTALFAPAASHAQTPAAPLSVRVDASNSSSELVVSPDEVAVVRHDQPSRAALAATVQSRLTGSQVVAGTETQAIVRLPGRLDFAAFAKGEDAVSLAFADSDVRPVLYPRNAMGDAKQRAVATRDVLVRVPAGKSPEMLVTEASALRFRRTNVSTHVILTFRTALQALNAVGEIQGRGQDASPLLERGATKRVVIPNDEFFKEQWHLINTGQGNGEPGLDANVIGAWKTTLGSGINLAIVDDSVQITHPDLRGNTRPVSERVNYDFNGDDFDPGPGDDFDRHGTAVAGVAAAQQNNAGLGVSGVAPSATLLGLRLIAGPFTDEEAAQALNWQPSSRPVHVNSNSWGPRDGSGLNPLGQPGILSRAALEQAATFGRNGRGQITLFAGGNGGEVCCAAGSTDGRPVFIEDNSNYDLYANSRFVVAVGAIANNGMAPWYGEPGANLLIAAPSNGGSLGIVTTDVAGVNGYNPSSQNDLPNTDYTNTFGGTSSATPLVAGSISLMLAANPGLGWRDVKEILASTARKIDSTDREFVANSANQLIPVQNWRNNEAGFHFNQNYGAGLVDTDAAVSRSLNWTNLGEEQSQTVALASSGTLKKVPVVIPDNNGGGVIDAVTRTPGLRFDFIGPAYPNLRLEQIEVRVKVNHAVRSDVEISVTSPSGITSVLAKKHNRPDSFDDIDQNYHDRDLDGDGVAEPWTFTSTHHWGENSQGTWVLTVRDLRFENFKQVSSGGNPNPPNADVSVASISLYGTNSPSRQRVLLATNPVSAESESATQRVFVSESATEQTFTVRRLGRVPPYEGAGEITVDYSVTRGSATAEDVANGVAGDYRPVSGSVTIPDGRETATFSVPLLNDDSAESQETVHVLLSNPRGTLVAEGVTLGGANMATLFITDDETNAVTIVPIDAEASEPSEPGTVRIQRAVGDPTPLEVRYSLSGTATPGNGTTGDYIPIELSAVIPAFETFVDVLVTPVDDLSIEGTETVEFTLTERPGFYVVGSPDTAVVNITDDDRPSLQIVATDDEAFEDPLLPVDERIGRFEISRTDSPDNNLMVRVSFGGTEEIERNYDLVDSRNEPVKVNIIGNVGIIVVPAGETSYELRVVPRNDSLYSPTKTIILRLLDSPDYDFTFGFLTSAQVTVFEDDQPAETGSPTLTVTSPRNGSRIIASDARVLLNGTAQDNVEIERIIVLVNGRDPQSVTPVAVVTPPGKPQKYTYSVDITDKLVFGTNTVTVQAFDSAETQNGSGNASRSTQITLTYVKNFALTTVVNPAGGGTISGGAGVFQREAGKKVTLTASPAAGKVFNGWTADAGIVLSNPLTRTITFNMPGQAATVTATFIDNPFKVDTVAGAYEGLIRINGLSEGVQFSHKSSGFVKLKVSTFGTFTGKITIGGLAQTLKGGFSGDGNFVGALLRKNAASVIVTLKLDVTGNTQRLIGKVDGGSFTSDVVATRAAYSTAVKAAPALVGKYTLVFPGADPIAAPGRDPAGHGVGTMTIDASGTVRWNGTLPDGTKATQATVLDKQNTWPLFVSLYAKGGVILGSASMVNTGVTTPVARRVEAQLDWSKPAVVKDKLYTNGFMIQGTANPARELIASAYVPPVKPARILAAFDVAVNNGGDILMTQGNLSPNTPVRAEVRISDANVVTVVGPNGQPFTKLNPDPLKLTLRFSVATGTFSGSFFHPVSKKTTPLLGVVFQDDGGNKAYGTFSGPSQTGRFLLTAD